MKIMGLRKNDLTMLWGIVKINLFDRYMGLGLGLFWAVINPLLLLGIYTFCFGFVFKAKIPGADTTLSYTVWFLSGFIPYLAISDGLLNCTSAVERYANLVKNVVFRLEYLPIAGTLVAAVPFGVGVVFLWILLLLDGNYPTWHAILLMPVIFLEFAFLAGVGFFLSATNVFIRDVSQAITTITMLIVFGTPIFFPLKILPKVVQKIEFFNPFYQIVQPYRDILVNHIVPDWKGMLYLICLIIMVDWAGIKYFKRLKGYFAAAL